MRGGAAPLPRSMAGQEGLQTFPLPSHGGMPNKMSPSCAKEMEQQIRLAGAAAELVVLEGARQGHALAPRVRSHHEQL